MFSRASTLERIARSSSLMGDPWDYNRNARVSSSSPLRTFHSRTHLEEVNSVQQLRSPVPPYTRIRRLRVHRPCFPPPQLRPPPFFMQSAPVLGRFFLEEEVGEISRPWEVEAAGAGVERPARSQYARWVGGGAGRTGARVAAHGGLS